VRNEAARSVDPRRRRAEGRGRRAETIAAWFLRLKLYRILARRYKTPVGEIDLIVRRGRTIAFIEVKQRPSETDAITAVTRAARRRIARAAELWVAAHPAAAVFDQRFDVVIAVPGRMPRHLVGVFGRGGESWTT
jgi:putative endonuclease